MTAGVLHHLLHGRATCSLRLLSSVHCCLPCLAVARFGDPDKAERTVFATLHDLAAVYQTHEQLEQQKPPDKQRGPPFVVSTQCSAQLPAFNAVLQHL